MEKAIEGAKLLQEEGISCEVSIQFVVNTPIQQFDQTIMNIASQQALLLLSYRP